MSAMCPPTGLLVYSGLPSYSAARLNPPLNRFYSLSNKGDEIDIGTNLAISRWFLETFTLPADHRHDPLVVGIPHHAQRRRIISLSGTTSAHCECALPLHTWLLSFPGRRRVYGF